MIKTYNQFFFTIDMSLGIDIYIPHTIIPIEITDKLTIKKFCHHYRYRENPYYKSNPKNLIYHFHLFSQQLTNSITNYYYLEINKTNWIQLLFRDHHYYLISTPYNIEINYSYTTINRNTPKTNFFCLPRYNLDYKTIGPIINYLTIEKKN